jgi:hypothetical protein
LHQAEIGCKWTIVHVGSVYDAKRSGPAVARIRTALEYQLRQLARPTGDALAASALAR